MADFKKLKVWQKAHIMALHAHRVAARIRGSDHAALRNQIIRCSMSIPANIVEGCSQETAANFRRFLRIALNSSTELEYHLIIARDLHLADGSDALTLVSQVVEVRKMIYGLIRHLASDNEARGLAHNRTN
jgi:four helix bundle protein